MYIIFTFARNGLIVNSIYNNIKNNYKSLIMEYIKHINFFTVILFSIITKKYFMFE